MPLAAPALLVAALLLAPISAGDDIVVVEETRVAESSRPERDARKPGTVRHSAVLKNAGNRSVRSIRVSVELYDYFGKLLWARTVAPTPAALRPGETAVLSLATPRLDAYRKTRYRFEYKTDASAR